MRSSLLALLAAAVVVAFAVVLTKQCSGESKPNAAPGQASDSAMPLPTPNGEVILTITQGGKLLRQWSLADLKAAVPFVTVTVDGEDENGPLLTEVLRASGVTLWTRGVAVGKGPGLATSVEEKFEAGQVDKTWVLDVTNRNTLKLAAASLTRQHWVRDVTEIRLD